MKKIALIYFLVLGTFLFSQAADAATLYLNSSKTSYRVGDSFQVSLGINTEGKSINTISGKVVVPLDKFQIADLRYGNSILTLWVDRPAIDYAAGTIAFGGGVPGGYGGSSGPILNFVLKAKKTGSAVVGLKDMEVLLNDGMGTPLTGLVLGKLNLSIAEALPAPVPAPKETAPAEAPVVALDTIAPESFIPLIGRDPSVADNRYFISFSAVDKDSGIDYYEVREEPLLLNWLTDQFSTAWVRTDSPYVLKHQLWINKVIVRAYDRSRNSTEGFALKPLHPYLLAALVIILMALASGITRYLSKPKHLRRKSKKDTEII